MVEQMSPDAFNVEAELARIQEDDVLASVSTFLEVESPLQLRVTTAQQICNMNDHKDVAIVFDMRSSSQFNECSLDKSVNFPFERFNEDVFVNWLQKVKQLETDATLFKDKYQVDKMKKRKRRFLYILPCQQTSVLKRYLTQMSIFTSQEKLAGALEACESAQDKADLLSLRNSLLLYKALVKERHREVFISLQAFDEYRETYPHYVLCSEKQHLRPQPCIAKKEGFCSEMYPQKVYLGKWQHAMDAQMIETLGITHILNISDSCENYLEQSHPNLKYLQLVIEDQQDKPISQCFQEAFEWLKLHTEEGHSTEDEIPDVELSEMSYPNSTAIIKLDCMMHTFEIMMTAQEKQHSRVQSHYQKINAAETVEPPVRVLIHCAMGKSRSATSFIMYTMRRFGMTMTDAFELSYSQRKETEPNEGFMEQLRIFEANQNRFESEL